MIRITDQYVWNIVCLLFFLWLVVIGGMILEYKDSMSYVDLTLFDLVLISLASFRVIRLFVYDSVTKFFREQFYDAKVTKTGTVTLHKPAKGLRRTIIDLLSCPWCFGVWATAMVTFFYLLTPIAFFPILILAVSAVATWLQLFANMIGWKAEQLKRDVEG